MTQATNQIRQASCSARAAQGTNPLFQAALLLALLAAFLCTAVPVRADEAPRSISVSGSAERRVAPDMATLQVEILKEHFDAGVARREADQLTNEALAVLRASGIADADIDSSGLSIQPQYRWNKAKQRQELTGYRVSRALQVRLLDLERLGEVLTGLTDAGVNRVQPPRLGLQDDETIYRSVLAEASRNARDRALVIAEALDESLGGLLQLSADRAPSAPRPIHMERAMMAADASMASPAESYQSGHVTYRVDIRASFVLE